MRTPRASTLIITGQSILLLVCLGYLALVLVRNYLLILDATRFAASAGFEEATRNFSHGHISLYEIKYFEIGVDDSGAVPTDGCTEPTGKMIGNFPVDYLLVDRSFPKGHEKIQQAFVDAYNQRMHLYFDHPEWFDKNGKRIPLHDLKQNTNAVNTSN